MMLFISFPIILQHLWYYYRLCLTWSSPSKYR